MREAVFFHVRPRQGEGLGELMEVIERFAPLAQSLAPSAAVAQVGGALWLFGVGPVGLAQRPGFRRLLCSTWAWSWGSALPGALRPWRPRVRGRAASFTCPASDTADVLGHFRSASCTGSGVSRPRRVVPWECRRSGS